MFEAKLQVGCLLIVLYFVGAYFREPRTKGHKKNIYFILLLVFSLLEIIFDGATAITVNQLDIVPSWVNLLLHGLFFVSVNAVIILDYLYMIDKTVGITSVKKLLLVLLPGIISMIGILIFLPQTEYTIGNRTNYSMGISPIICFSSLIVHFLMVLVLVLTHHRTIERAHLFDIIVFIALILGVLITQILLPEILVSALLPPLSLIVLYIVFENPSFAKLQHYNNEMVMGFATIVENRDDSTGGHIRRTQVYVDIILEELKKNPDYKKILTKDYIINVKNAAPLHDVGKVSTPDNILLKPGKLTNEEYEIMKTHSKKGGIIIEDTFANLDEPKYQKIAYEVATYHHEKWNGKGYPLGLKEEEIPLHARIMSVADVFDAVSANRCYRSAMPLDECFKIIENGIGTDFDPVIAKTFLNARKKVEKIYHEMAKEPSK